MSESVVTASYRFWVNDDKDSGDTGGEQSANMIHPEWNNYTNRLWATEWHSLFPTNDGRNALTWRDRFSNLPLTNVYNFYSSGEEILREHVGEPPNDISQTVALEVYWLLSRDPVGVYSWALQEKSKGRTQVDFVLGSTHGGWKFNDHAYGTNSPVDSTVWWHMSAQAAALISTNELKTNTFFDLTSGVFTNDAALIGPSASSYAQANRNRILSDAIPALTLPVGANEVPLLSPLGQSSRNFDMSSSDFKNGWPAERLSKADGAKWHHSDFRNVAYTYTHKLFDKFVELGDLK